MTAALALDGVVKRYSRKGAPALAGLSCSFPTGAISGLVGPNGAGKTTLFAVVCGFLQPDAGSVDILGDGPFDVFRLKGRLGVLPQDAAMGAQLTCRGFLEYLGGLQGMRGREARESATQALSEVLLSDRADDRVGSLSHGMRRRLSVASALLGTPELILLDEPMAGLDPAQAKSLRGVLAGLRGKATVVVSSHDLDELERLCDHVVLIDEGRLVRQGTIAEVTGRGALVRWTLGPGDVPLDALREALPDCRIDLEGRDLLYETGGTVTLDEASVVVARLLAEANVPIRAVQRGTSLEESFLSETRAG